ncbi:MAG: transporter substrate-binding domain-containing protein, partial [Bacilli bacterium]|nr:transporter substrate-binding domain-containing protein [Bacilli bacterium]
NNTLTVNREDQFIVGLECGYAPFNWTTSKSTITSVKIDNASGYCDGYDVKIARLIAVHLDKQLVIKALAWEALIPQLQAGNIDAIIAGMSPTEERKQSIDFSDVYFTSEQVVVVRKDSPFVNVTSIHDFEGARITAQKETLQEELIDQMTGAIKATSLEDYAALVLATASGAVDGFIAELPVAMSVVMNNSQLTYIRFSERNGFEIDESYITTAIGLRKGDTVLRDQINAVLASISQETRETWMEYFIKNE